MKRTEILSLMKDGWTDDSIYRKACGNMGLFGQAFFGHKKTRLESRRLNDVWRRILSVRNQFNSDTPTGSISSRKEFLVSDKSGRSAKPYKLDDIHIKKHWNLSENDWNTEEKLSDFLDRCDVGDSWCTNSEEIECINVENK
jgi:hypothetical protein